MKIHLVSLFTAFLATLAAGAESAPRKLSFENDSSIYLANLDGTGKQKISQGQCPDLSPDGTKLAFNTVQVDGQPAHRQIAIADVGNGQITVFKEIPSENCMAPRWSPDGKRLIFDYYTANNNDRLLGVINADGTGFAPVLESGTQGQNYWAATWAADGQSFFAEDMENLYRLDLHGKVLKKWKIEAIAPRGGMSGDIRMDASPDGKFLLMDVEMDEKERKGWDGPPPSIWKFDLTTEKATRLTPKTLYAWDCHWLNYPDSILFISEAQGEENPSIYRMLTNGNGKDRKRLITNGRTPGASR